ncbi:restriction endonuclease [Amycolatopsis pigmentata]|uniref:Restriction endonuclease n=1 Tax=Amycolatopsis pigmentata TaxID=450801 RepID=A0ABW5FMI6_9PSEU
MGAIWMPRGKLVEDLIDLVGARVGLAVNEASFENSIRSTEYVDLLRGESGELIRIRSEAVEELAALVLAHFGDIKAEEGPFATMKTCMDLWRDNPNREAPMRRLLEIVAPQIRQRSDSGILFISSYTTMLSLADLGFNTPSSTRQKGYISKEQMQRATEILKEEFGETGNYVAIRIFDAILREREVTFLFSRIRRYTQEQQISLTSLFESQALNGDRFDQRYIDFLSVNLDEIDRINWRQFEALCAEYFSRQGLHVQLGPGANDNGVDIRVWPQEGNVDAPPLILIQCKRQRVRVSKTVVKALWADVSFEEAKMGLIATTSDLEPGAKMVRETRGYPVDIANRDAIREWIAKLRTPRTGLFLPDTLP